ncbi:MAG: tetratricopeptide repeat protein [Chitinispirillales bacterium]|jgi:tetratricopeptide (TPR) repeat protein|nr:tetratricopeptide repeat protein [Chitinispirillales bacterium]
MTDAISDKIVDAAQKICDKDYKNAMSILVDVIDEDPNCALAYNYLGIIAWEESRWEDSYGLFKEAATLDKGNEDAINNLIDSAFKLHKIEDIIPIVETAAQENPQSEELTGIYKTLSDKTNDIYKCDRALHIGWYNPLIEAGDNFAQSGNYDEARRKYIEAFDTSGPSAEAYNGLGIIQFNAKEYREAFLLFFESIKMNPTNIDTFLNLFDSAKNCGEEETALQIYETLAAEYSHLKRLKEEAQSLNKN